MVTIIVLLQQKGYKLEPAKGKDACLEGPKYDASIIFSSWGQNMSPSQYIDHTDVWQYTHNIANQKCLPKLQSQGLLEFHLIRLWVRI